MVYIMFWISGIKISIVLLIVVMKGFGILMVKKMVSVLVLKLVLVILSRNLNCCSLLSDLVISFRLLFLVSRMVCLSILVGGLWWFWVLVILFFLRMNLL